MDVLKLSSVVKRHYEEVKPRSVYHGWEKYILTNGTECVFVNASYEPDVGEAVFYLRTQSGKTICELKSKLDG